MPSKERENSHNPLESVEEPIYSAKSILVDTHQPISVELIKSLENSFDDSTAVENQLGSNNRESISDSPLRTRRSISSSGIYELIWPQPKCILELGHVSPPFIVGKELLISIIQVSCKKYLELIFVKSKIN